MAMTFLEIILIYFRTIKKVTYAPYWMVFIYTQASTKMVKVKMKSPWKRYVLLAFDLWHL